MLKVQHLIREKNVEVSEEERMANVELVKALTDSIRTGSLDKDWVREGGKWVKR
jgi:hypothetical protein